MALSLVDALAAAPAHADLPAVVEDLDAGARRAVAATTHDLHVREVDGPFALDDPALAQLLGRPLVLLDHVDVLDQDAARVGHHAQHLAPLAALLARQHRDGVSPPDLDLEHQMTSGASEMILVN